MSDSPEGDEKKIPYELYQNGVVCKGSGSVLFPPDPEFPDRGVCLRCSCSIAVIDDHHLDFHIILPELVTSTPWDDDENQSADGVSV